MKIQLTEEQKTRAREQAEKFFELNVEGKENHIFKTDDNLEKKRLGYLGEIGFAEYLSKKEIKFKTDDCLYRSDEYDFNINNKIFDVKTTYFLNYSCFSYVLVNKQQIESSKSDYYVFALLHLGDIDLIGFISKEDIKKLPLNTKVQSLAYEVRKENLRSVLRLKEVI
jgi:hypothetical protein